MTTRIRRRLALGATRARQSRMLRFASAAGIAVGAFAWVAAPALSLRPYLPPAKDFGQELPAMAAVGHQRFLAPPTEAPHEFDFVGIGGERREVEIRTRRDDDGTWSDWVEVEGGDPLYAPGSDAAQVRTDDFRPSGDLHYVNVSGTSGGIGESLLGSARSAINDAFVTAATSAPVRLLSPATAAAAAPPAPTFVSRAGWGADNATGGCQPRSGPAYGSVNAVAVHHTVSTVDYAPEEAPAIVLGICRYHLNGNGWNDIGYNALVDRFGVLYEGRAGGVTLPVVGAHTEGYNAQAAGVASIGDHTLAPMTLPAEDTVVRYLAWKLTISGQLPGGFATLTSAGGETNRYKAGDPVTVDRIFGHGTTNVTACPGPLLAGLLPDIRSKVQGLVKRYAGGKKGKKKKKRKKKHRRHHRHHHDGKKHH